MPLFLASFAGFFAALPAIAGIPKMRALALREARQEYAEYYFLFPLFLSITLLTAAGFFEGMQGLIRTGSRRWARRTSRSPIPRQRHFSRRFLTTTSSPISRREALHGFDIKVLHLFAMAQIAGYALGGCWTHIGCAQSVVAYAFIQRDVDEHYRPVQWIREMTPVIVKILVVMTAIIYIESALLKSAMTGPWPAVDSPTGVAPKAVRERVMKLIASLVRPDRVVDIKLALGRLNIFAIAVAEIHDYAPQNHGTTVWRGHEYSYGSSLKMEVRVVGQDDEVDGVIEVIMRAAKTGRVGDGHVCVLPVDHRYDILSGRREVS